MRRRRRRLAGLLAVAATGASLAVAIPAAVAAPKPPPKPSTGAVSAAQVQAALNNKNQLAALVGSLSGQVAESQIELNKINAKLQYTEQLMALRLSQEETAKQDAVVAKAAVATASKQYTAAHDAYVRYITAVYSGQDNDMAGTASSLLTASDPSALLTQSTLLAYQARKKSAAVDDMQTAQVVRSNAEAKAKAAQQKAVAATAAAKKAVATTAALYQSSKAQAAALQSQLNDKQAEAAAAKSAYNSKVTARNKYVSYLNAVAAYKAYQAHQAELARERAAAALAAARAREQQQSNGGGSGGGGGGGGSSASPPPSGGSWTAAKGRAAAHRAEDEIGVMYAWAGGNAYGPTRGVCAGDGAWNDCNVIGFDCSGLAMFAWGQSWAHFAATQYYQAGSYHPPVSQLLPGDLLFWSYGSLADIHHVAIYIGNGQMVEAPESGVPTRIASIYEYGTITGTTRPLT